MSAKESLISDLNKVSEMIDARLRENDSILEQNRLEVSRLQQRSVNVSAQLKRVEDNFDTWPRSDIKVAYEETIEVRTRMTAMQSQLEKFQETHDRLKEFKATMEDILSRIGDVEVADGSAGGNGLAPGMLSLAGDQIVRIVEAQESERQQLANRLHDGPAQSLTNFILQAEICQRLFNRDPDRANAELQNLKAAASVSFQKLRDYIFELRPMMLDDLGLVATVRRHVENINEKENIAADFALTGAERRFPKHVEVIMFRSLQQAVTDVRDVLNAKTIKVQLDIANEQVRGIVESDGRGFSPDAALDNDAGDSPMRNLADLEERVGLVGGSLQLYSTEGEEGSRIEIILPFSDNDMNL